jgi:hypothetical protein
VDRDWTVRAGDLDWDVRSTLTHVCDAVAWYAAHLAVQCRHRLRLDFRVHDDATKAEVLNILDAAAATLAQVHGPLGRTCVPTTRPAWPT